MKTTEKESKGRWNVNAANPGHRAFGFPGRRNSRGKSGLGGWFGRMLLLWLSPMRELDGYDCDSVVLVLLLVVDRTCSPTHHAVASIRLALALQRNGKNTRNGVIHLIPLSVATSLSGFWG